VKDSLPWNKWEYFQRLNQIVEIHEKARSEERPETSSEDERAVPVPVESKPVGMNITGETEEYLKIINRLSAAGGQVATVEIDRQEQVPKCLWIASNQTKNNMDETRETPKPLAKQFLPGDEGESNEDLTPRGQWGNFSQGTQTDKGTSLAELRLPYLPHDGDETDDDATPRNQWVASSPIEKNEGGPDKVLTQGVLKIPRFGNQSEPITTIAIRNLLYSLKLQDLLAAMDESGYVGLYDFVYLPHKGKANKNLGFAFVNFIDAHVAGRFCADWHRTRRQKLGTRNHPLNLSAATVQGRRANQKIANSNKVSHLGTTFSRPT